MTTAANLSNRLATLGLEARKARALLAPLEEILLERLPRQKGDDEDLLPSALVESVRCELDVIAQWAEDLEVDVHRIESPATAPVIELVRTRTRRKEGTP